MFTLKIQTIPQGKINEMPDTRRAYAEAANRALKSLKMRPGFNYVETFRQWRAGEITMATLGGRIRHSAIVNYEDALEPLKNMAYNMARERVMNSIIELLGEIDGHVIAQLEKKVNQQKEEVTKLRTENALLRNALKQIANNYVLDNHDAIANLLEKYLEE